MIIIYEMIACFIYIIIKHLVTQSRSNKDLRMNYLLYYFMTCSVKPFESDFATKKIILFTNLVQILLAILVAITGQKIVNLVQQIRNNNSVNMLVLFYNFVIVLVSEYERNIYAFFLYCFVLFVRIC